jgi:DNA polymerase III subunit delta'
MQYLTGINIQPQVVQRLAESIRRNRLAHAYLFYGPEGSGKEVMAFELAKALNCKDPDRVPCGCCASCNKISQLIHPDVKYIFPTAAAWKPEDLRERIRQKIKNPYAGMDLSGHTSIQIERVRDLKNEAKFTPYEADKKIYIVSHAEKMTRESSNSFLKILEEPPANLMIILITSMREMLLATIRSRCQLMYFHPLNLSEIFSVVSQYHPLSDRVKKAARLCQGNLVKVFQELDVQEDDRRDTVYAFVRALLTQDDVQLFKIIDDLARLRDKNYLLNILVLLTLWFQDILHAKLFGNQAEIVYIDYQAEIIRLSEIYASGVFEDIFECIEQAGEQIRQNVYPQLVWTVLALQIRKVLQQAKGIRELVKG